MLTRHDEGALDVVEAGGQSAAVGQNDLGAYAGYGTHGRMDAWAHGHDSVRLGMTGG